MTHFLVNIDRSFLSKVTNVLLIRNPSEIISSYAKSCLILIWKIWVQMQYELFHELKEKSISRSIRFKGLLKIQNCFKVVPI